MESEEGKIYFGMGLDNKQLQDDARRAVAEFQGIGDKAEAEGHRIDNAFKTAAASIGVSLAGISVGGFVKKMFQVRSEFQDTESSMKVFLGSAEKAADFMKKLQDYAWYNMFEFSDLTKESAKLLAFGNDVDSVIPILDKLSNIAAGTKVPLSDLVDLYDKAKNVGKIDAMGLQSWATKGVVITDVLKQMGVEVDSSAIKFEHLEMVLNKLTSEGGMFHGLMNEQMQNLSASFGQLQDDISIMFNEIGQKAEGTMKGLIDSADWVVKNYEKVGKTILDIAVAYGVYRAAIMSVVAIQKVSASVQYSTEIAELSKLLPLKEQSAFADIQAAVASGRLTQAKAEQLIAVRTEIQAKLDELKANQSLAVSELTNATAARKAALEKSIAIRASISAKQTELVQAKLAGDAQKVEKLQKELSTLANQKDTIAVEMNTASKARATAQAKVKSTTTAVETMTTNINTAGTVANANAHNILSIAKIKLTAIAAKLNAVIMANPYMLVAAAVAALAFGIYKLVTANNASEIATRSLNDELEKQKELKDNLISKTHQLSNVLSDNTKTIYEQIEAYQKLKKELPEVYAKMTFQQAKELTPEQHSKMQSEAADNRSLKAEAERIAKLEDLLRRAKEITFFDSANDSTGVRGDFFKLFDVGIWERLKISNNDIVKSIEQQLNGYKEIREERKSIIEQDEFNKKTDSEKLSILKEQLQKYQDQYNELEKQLPETARIADTIDKSLSPSISAVEKGVFGVNTEWGNFDPQTQIIIAQLNILNGKLNETKGIITGIETANAAGITYAQAKQDAKDAYDKAKKLVDDISKNGKNYSKDAYVKATEDLDKAKKDYQALGGETTVKKGSDDRQKRLDALKRLTEIEKEQALEMERFRLDMAQREIDLMDDSYEKRRRQLELNLEKEAQTIEEFKQKKLKEQQDVEKEQWRAGGKTGTFTPTTISFDQLNDDVKAQAEQLTKAADAAYAKGLENIKRDSIKALEEENLRLASALTKQLADIRQNYAERIKAAKGNAELIKKLEENREKEISIATIDNSLQSLDIKKEIEIEKQKLINKTYLFEADKEYALLKIERDSNEERLKLLQDLKEQGVQDLEDEIDLLTVKITGMNAELEKIPMKKIDEMLSGLQKITGALSQLGGEVGEVFQALSGAVDSIKQSFDIAKQGSLSMADYAGQASTAISGIVDIINIVSAASAKRKQAENDFYKNQIALAHEYALALNEQLRIQSEISGSGFVTDYAGKINDGFAALTDATNKYQEALGKLGEGKAKIDLRNAIDWGAVGKGAASGAMSGAAIGTMIVPVIGTAIGAVAGAIIGGLTGLFGGKKKKDVTGGLLDVFPELVDESGKLNKELAQTLINTDQVDEKTKQLIQNTLDWDNAIEEANKQIKEVVVDLAGDLGNNLKKSIIDAWKAGEDASKNMFDAASKSLEKFVEDLLFSAIFSDLFDQFKEDLAKTLSPEGDKDVVGAYDKFTKEWDELQKIYTTSLDAIKKRAGEKGFDLWNNEDAKNNDNSLKGAYAKASQESIDLLAGQFGGIRVDNAASRLALESIRDYQAIANAQVKGIMDSMNYMKDIYSRVGEEVKAIRQLSIRVADNSDRIKELSASISDNTHRSAGVLESVSAGNKLRVIVNTV